MQLLRIKVGMSLGVVLAGAAPTRHQTAFHTILSYSLLTMPAINGSMDHEASFRSAAFALTQSRCTSTAVLQDVAAAAVLLQCLQANLCCGLPTQAVSTLTEPVFLKASPGSQAENGMASQLQNGLLAAPGF